MPRAALIPLLLLLVFLLLLLPASSLLAKPPTLAGFARLDDLERDLGDKAARLKASEEFALRPFQERLLLKFIEGAESYEHLRRLDAEDLVEELLEKWKEARTDEPTPEVERTLALLPGALGLRFTLNAMQKAERYKASRPLVDALTDKHEIIRRTAINCLRAIYSTSLGYEPDLPSGKRYDLQKDWKKQIDKLRR